MNFRIRLTIFSSILILLWAADVSAMGFRLSEMNAGGQIHAVKLLDVDGDGRKDIAASVSVGVSPDVQRKIVVFFAAQDGSFPPGPSVSLTVPAGACLFDLADLDGDGKMELVLYYRHQVTAAPVTPSGAGKTAKIIGQGCAVVFPEREDLPIADLARNWRGKGTQILLPDYGRLVFFERSGAAYVEAETLPVEMEGSTHTAASEDQKGLGFSTFSSVRVPELFLADFNADGEEDLFALNGETVVVFRQQNGRFEGKPVFKQVYKVRTPQEAKNKNVTVSMQAKDLNGDGFGDLVVNKFGGSLMDFYSQVRVFRGGSAGLPTQPTYSLDAKGFSGGLDFPDADGDGCFDLVSPSVEITVMALIRLVTTKKATVQFNLYRCGGAALYPSKPDFTAEVPYQLDMSRNFEVIGTRTIFGRDFNADGRPDLLMGTGPDRLGVFLSAAGVSFSREAAATINAPSTNHVIVDDIQQDKRGDVILWYSTPEREGKIRVYINGQAGNSREK